MNEPECLPGSSQISLVENLNATVYFSWYFDRLAFALWPNLSFNG